MANFLGSLLPTLRNVFDRLQSSCGGDEADLLATADSHVLDSSLSAVQEKAQQHRKGVKRKLCPESMSSVISDPADLRLPKPWAPKPKPTLQSMRINDSEQARVGLGQKVFKEPTLEEY